MRTSGCQGILGCPTTFDEKGDVRGAQVYIYQVKGEHFEQPGATLAQTVGARQGGRAVR